MYIFAGLELRNSQFTNTIDVYVVFMPMSDDTPINASVSGHSPVVEKLSASALWRKPRISPTCAIAAPAYPPMSAWVELVGNLSHHVIRSQVMAPTSPAMST